MLCQVPEEPSDTSGDDDDDSDPDRNDESMHGEPGELRKGKVPSSKLKYHFKLFHLRPSLPPSPPRRRAHHPADVLHRGGHRAMDGQGLRIRQQKEGALRQPGRGTPASSCAAIVLAAVVTPGDGAVAAVVAVVVPAALCLLLQWLL